MVQAIRRVQSAHRRRAHRPRHPEVVRRRVEQLLHTEIDFIMSPSFKQGGEELEREAWEAALLEQRGSNKLPSNLPAHLARLCEADILTAAQERSLFCGMNFLKHRANALRARLDPVRLDEDALERVERLLKGAEAIRNRLIKANMRLVVSVVRKFVSPRHSFDDLLSDGIFSLMQAVDKFDFERGFRFSTYAYRAIARNTYRMVMKRQQEAVRYSTDATEASTEGLIDERSPAADLDTWLRLRETLSLLINRLDRREQLIVRARYALGGHRKVKTFQAIAEKLGVSKERVRQLEQRAMSKLRTMAAELDLEDAVEPSLS